MVIYRLINKSNNKFDQYRSAAELYMYLLGREINSYIVLKSDELGDRAISLSTPMNINNSLPTMEEFKNELEKC